MARPRISEETADHIEDIYREYRDQDPPDFETALATVLELASAKAEDDRGWRPGKYAKKTMQMVLDDAAKHPDPPPRTVQVDRDRVEFRAVLDDEGYIEVPVADRRAFGLEPDDLLEVTVQPFDSDDD